MEEERREGLEQQEAKQPEAAEEPSPEEALQELNDKYLRLYAEFDNYKKRTARDKEELARYANESLLFELLPTVDHLEIALTHANDETSKGLAEGVEMTLREFLRTMEKFGLTPIEAQGKPFDPAYHHAVSRVHREDVAEGTVVEELRKGYLFNGKVLRASLVAVSQKPPKAEEAEAQEPEEVEINNHAKGES